MYDEYGPTPRICFNYLYNDHLLTAHQQSYEQALAILSTQKLRQVVQDVTQFSKELRVNTTQDDCPGKVVVKVELVSLVVEREVQVRLWEQSRAEQLELYRQFANVQETRCIACLAFESLAHKKLRKRIVLDLIPMVLRGLRGSGEGKKQPRWHSNHGGGEDPSSVRPIDITPLTTDVYEGSRPDQIDDKVYFVPKSKNQVAFDSFIMADGNLYIFQCSIASNHPIKADILPFFSPYPLPPQDRCYFVFVVPKEPAQEITCPQPQDRDPGLKALKALLAPDKMKLYTALLDIAQP
jgi:hypothetical protein